MNVSPNISFTWYYVRQAVRPK